MSKRKRKLKGVGPLEVEKWMPECSRILSPKKRAFLTAYSEHGTISHAAKAVGIPTSTHHNWITGISGTPEEIEAYKKSFELAKDRATETLEREARRRASEGVDEPVYYKGKVVGSVKKYSDLLLIFLLKGAMPEKYRERIDNTHEVTIHLAEEIKKARARIVEDREKAKEGGEQG